jgi:hypothetical protein
MIYLHINFPILVSSDSLVIAIKLIVEYSFSELTFCGKYSKQNLHHVEDLLP